MPCEAPLTAWRPANGGPLRFNPPTDGRAYNQIPLPCGTCILCREEQARQQAVRIAHEATCWPENSFVTLSYNDKHLPKWGGLNYDDLRMFIDRARKTYEKFRYYAVGEYGDKSLRPHYHMCVFNQAFTENRVILRREPSLLWTTAELEALWGKGFVSVGALNFATANYTASYVTKKLRLKQKYVRVDETTGELIELEQPRSFMSRNLGKEWWVKWRQQTHINDYVIIDGRRQKPPKAYDKWLAANGGEKQLEAIKENRKKHAIKQTSDEIRARAESARTRRKEKRKSI